MFYQWLYPLSDQWFVFNVFRYITFRAAAASVTAFILSIWLGPLVTRCLSGLQVVNDVKRDHAAPIHAFYANKAAVPTMGGILIIGSLVVSNLLWGNLENRLLLLVLGVVVWFGMIGFADDFLKFKRRGSRGLSARVKLAGQLAAGFVVGAVFYSDPNFPTSLHVPFLKDLLLPLGLWFIPFSMLVLVSSSNALNLTDGLDGLAIGCIAFAAGAFSILSYLVGRPDFANYLGIPHVIGAGELTVFCSSLVGAAVGFLWYNCYPATLMMGDTGSLSLGAALGLVAILTKSELTLVLVGGVFVWEAASVILQVLSFRLLGRRIFRMAPFHHHLQLKGWPESKVTVRLWIVAFILAILSLATLKLR